MKRRHTSPRISANYYSTFYRNPIIVAWKYFACEMDHQTFQRLYDSYSVRFKLWRAMRKLMKSMTPEQRAYLDKAK